jgi:hypothetical protein
MSPSARDTSASSSTPNVFFHTSQTADAARARIRVAGLRQPVEQHPGRVVIDHALVDLGRDSVEVHPFGALTLRLVIDNGAGQSPCRRAHVRERRLARTPLVGDHRSASRDVRDVRRVGGGTHNLTPRAPATGEFFATA